MNVEASGLGKRYGAAWALRECTLAVPAGQVAALVGPNGAGKSTLLYLAVGLTSPCPLPCQQLYPRWPVRSPRTGPLTQR